MNPNILDSYLVSLGFEIDNPAYRRFKDALAQADASVEQHADGMVRSILKAQVGILGAFTSISASIIGMADHVASADQSYRLFALRMLMTGESARKLQLITGALGASLEEIVWDPELHRRAVEMSGVIDGLSKDLGPDFETKMLRLRDLRFEFSKLEMGTKFLGMNFIGRLFDKLPMDEITAKVRGFIDWFEESIPRLSEELATGAVPILRETWSMLKQMGEAAKEFGVLFQNVIGLLSGDSSIEGTTLSLEKMATAFSHVLSASARFFYDITQLEKELGHFAIGVSLLFEKKWSEAAGEFKKAAEESTLGSNVIKGVVIGGVGGSVVPGVGTLFGGALGGLTALGATMAGAAISGDHSDLTRSKADQGRDLFKTATPASGGMDLYTLAAAIKKQEGGDIPGTLPWRNNNPGDLIFAHQPGAVLGEGGFARFNSPEEGESQLERQLMLYAGRGMTLEQMIMGVNGRGGWTDPKRDDQKAYLAAVMARTGYSPSATLTKAGSTTINFNGGITVNGTNKSAREIASEMASQTRDMLNSQTQFDMAQTNPHY